MSTPTTCQTCSSTLPSPLPQSTHQPPCCNHPICLACTARNPRLREYVPCLKCGTGSSILSGGVSVEAGGTRDRARDREEVGGGGGGGGDLLFAMGDEDDDGLGPARIAGDLPPGYDEIDALPSLPPSQTPDSHVPPPHIASEPTKAEEEPMEIVEVTHLVSRGDTVMSVARKYAADPHDILEFNALPSTALTSNARILQTRKSIIISRRSVPSSSLPPLSYRDKQLEAAVNKAESENRRKERQIQRFRAVTKAAHPEIANAYLSVEQLEEGKDVDYGTGEALEGGGKKIPMPSEGNREARALDRFWEDEDWESNSGRAERKKVGKWKVVGSSLAK
ncbi:hypothetical protein L202_03945 [Cryptococcus amylolentus CBS 6039]|uniref:LysM domain-containing protein n=1 Tax=Cryptococcus amylolentus CBS 6039 TaxID=1295533 RepID=A0A1E3HS77_9TREE|nr:hypothetical protein L202_03945 [Cryptococcus amylolentus CBS 6039]ODN78301.1 hypothetical protein L202_03945 [Cryptococcus amylolentus CBS 6039]